MILAVLVGFIFISFSSSIQSYSDSKLRRSDQSITTTAKPTTRTTTTTTTTQKPVREDQSAYLDSIKKVKEQYMKASDESRPAKEIIKAKRRPIIQDNRARVEPESINTNQVVESANDQEIKKSDDVSLIKKLVKVAQDERPSQIREMKVRGDLREQPVESSQEGDEQHEINSIKVKPVEGKKPFEEIEKPVESSQAKKLNQVQEEQPEIKLNKIKTFEADKPSEENDPKKPVHVSQVKKQEEENREVSSKQESSQKSIESTKPANKSLDYFYQGLVANTNSYMKHYIPDESLVDNEMKSLLIPVLFAVMSAPNGDILELGASGRLSALLDQISSEFKRNVYTLDTDSELVEKLMSKATSKQHFFSSTDKLKEIEKFSTSRLWAVAIIDHTFLEVRKADALRLANRARIVIAHDAESTKESVFGYAASKVTDNYKYVCKYSVFLNKDKSEYKSSLIMSNYVDLTHLHHMFSKVRTQFGQASCDSDY